MGKNQEVVKADKQGIEAVRVWFFVSWCFTVVDSFVCGNSYLIELCSSRLLHLTSYTLVATIYSLFEQTQIIVDAIQQLMKKNFAKQNENRHKRH